MTEVEIWVIQYLTDITDTNWYLTDIFSWGWRFIHTFVYIYIQNKNIKKKIKIYIYKLFQILKTYLFYPSLG